MPVAIDIDILAKIPPAPSKRKSCRNAHGPGREDDNEAVGADEQDGQAANGNDDDNDDVGSETSTSDSESDLEDENKKTKKKWHKKQKQDGPVPAVVIYHR